MTFLFRSLQSRTLIFLLSVQIGVVAAHSQTFSSTESMPAPLAYSTATVLQDGTVLVAGGANPGTGATASATIYNPNTGLFSPTNGQMNTARYAHTATLLPNGDVLIAGGDNSSGYPISSAELYIPATRSFSTTGSMTTARDNATSTLLNDGTVLVAGGVFQVGTASAEIYAPATGTFSVTGNMTTKRVDHTATLLPDGSVLIAGGLQNYTGETVLNSSEKYVPSTRQFTAVGNMTTARCAHSATLLTDGTILIAGGLSSSDNPLSSAEIYTPSTASFATTGALNTARYEHTATPLEDGTVLIAGGSTESNVPGPGDWSPFASSAEVYNPSNHTFTISGSMVTPRGGQAASLLNNGTVLEAGGGYGNSNSLTATAELYSYPFTSGAMRPKYVVLGILYSPPGAKSTVTYTGSTAFGTSSSIANAFANGTTVSASLGISLGKKSVTGSISGTVSQNWTQQADSTSTYTINQTKTNALGANGPLSSAIGIDHDYDQVVVWLNPKLNLSVGVNTANILWSGNAYDSDDIYSPNGLDIVTLSIFCLKNPSLTPDCTANNYLTSRSWDTSGVGGLTLGDYAAIAQRDPFYANPLYNPNNDSTNRFTFIGQTIDFTPAAPGDGANFWSGSLAYQAVTSAGQDASDSYQVSFGMDAALKSVISANLQSTNTTTWTNKWSETQTNTVGQSAAYSITGPLATDNYSGPTEFEVWQDNVYGTFMFVAPGTTLLSSGNIGVSPNSVTFSTPIAVGSHSNSVQVTLTNNSTMSMFMGVSSAFPFTQSSTALSPVAAFSDPSFSVVSGTDNCTGKIVPPAGWCTLSVQFSPLATDPVGSGGAISGTMYLTGETDAVVLATVSLAGTEAAATGTAAIPTISIPPVGVINTAAGNGTAGYSGDGGAAISAELYNPSSVAVDTSGNIYIVDVFNSRIRKVSASTGIISTVAGNGTAGFSGDGGAAISAELYYPSSVAVDMSGNIYIADLDNLRIRKVSASTGIISTVAGNGTAGYTGDGGAAYNAEIRGVYGIAVDASGNIYVADSGNNRIRKITVSTGIISTVAGGSSSGYLGDGGAATSANLIYPEDVAVDTSGNFYIADTDNNRIRVVSGGTYTCYLGGGIQNAQAVVADATQGATIYYTTDGTTPTISSTPYTGPVSIGQTAIFNAIAVATGYSNSAVATVPVLPLNCAGLSY